jgi:hypothetical protein
MTVLSRIFKWLESRLPKIPDWIFYVVLILLMFSDLLDKALQHPKFVHNLIVNRTWVQ